MVPSSCVPVLSEDADHFELDVLLRHEDHVSCLALFEFGCLIAHDSLVGVLIGKPAPCLNFRKGFISLKLLGSTPKYPAMPPLSPLFGSKTADMRMGVIFSTSGFFGDVLHDGFLHIAEACSSLQH